jgi:hypothetical protein
MGSIPRLGGEKGGRCRVLRNGNRVELRFDRQGVRVHGGDCLLVSACLQLR